MKKKCRCQIQREHQKSVRLRKECGVAGSDWLSAGPVIWFNDAPTAYFAAMMDPKLTAAPTHVFWSLYQVTQILYVELSSDTCFLLAH